VGAAEGAGFAAQVGWQAPPLHENCGAQSEGAAQVVRQLPVAELQL
jgi:hypothetical protein